MYNSSEFWRDPQRCNRPCVEVDHLHKFPPLSSRHHERYYRRFVEVQHWRYPKRYNRRFVEVETFTWSYDWYTYTYIHIYIYIYIYIILHTYIIIAHVSVGQLEVWHTLAHTSLKCIYTATVPPVVTPAAMEHTFDKSYYSLVCISGGIASPTKFGSPRRIHSKSIRTRQCVTHYWCKNDFDQIRTHSYLANPFIARS